ncbi:MAG: sigma-54-dependent Fis family transcriptional regulator [Deltaproteobacteria bacterium]|nr:sigma-54-dependent Fis family transcriptional regulator [Deltaproteobacteria bacterium]MBW1951766.1 sigma-54-dependent Fis family transcriptional regulator [Deltaproteobacteria bacterium]MBW1986838.1 sigma-54-dependent Fis family transcriptional regulator [Deltaproteobacteria bacterium]MBW2134961.1 sigma-54-dependent Fis family transcriptional regulator [Deltaproteobacteria bacterium]
MSAKILIIDDETDMLVMLKMLITDKTPHEVVTTNNPIEVEELLSENDFNIVITDLKMPMMDGIEVLEAVKKKDPDIPVIMITAFGTLEAAQEAVHRGAYDFITKPFRKEQILVALERALEWQRIVKENRNLKSRIEE